MIRLQRGAIVMLRTNGGKHPHIALTDPFKIKGRGRAKILSVTLSTSQSDKFPRDTTLEFKESPDRWIGAGSYVAYRNVKLQEMTEVEQEIVKYQRNVKVIGRKVLARVIKGFWESPETPSITKELYQIAQRQGKAD